MILNVFAKPVQEYCLLTHKFGKESFCTAIHLRELKADILKEKNIPTITVLKFLIINFR